MCELNSDNETNKQIQRAISASCRILAIREHSVKQLKQKLIKKGFSSSVVNQSTDWVIRENWLSEERFCGSYIRAKAAKGLGKLRIESELLQQNIDETLIDKCFAEEACDWQLSCERVAQKKLNSLIPDGGIGQKVESELELNWQQLNSIKSKLERFLRYRGFTNDEIKSTLRQCFNKQESN